MTDQTPTPTEPMSFDEAFAAIGTAEDQAANTATPAVEPAEPAVTEPTAEPAAAEPAAVEPVVAEPAAAEPATVDDPMARIAAMQAEIDVLKTPAVIPTQATKPAAEEPALYTADEQAALDTYSKDWPDIQVAESLIRRAEYQTLVSHIFKEVQARYEPMLTFYMDQAGDTHYNNIVKAHSDYDSLVDNLQGWIKAQPAGLGRMMQQVAETGSTEDIIELVSLYKKANGVADAVPVASQTGLPTAATAARAAPVVVKPASAPQVSPAAKQAATRLSLVDTKRAAPAAVAAVDFDSAFDEAVRADSKS